MKIELTEQDCELLSRYLDGELGAEESQALRARLLSEPSLRAAYERFRAVDARLREAFDAPGADTVPANVTQMVRAARTRGHEGGPTGRTGWGLGVAVAVLVVAGVVVNYLRQDQDGAQFMAQDALVAPVLERTLSRGEGWEVLPDGTRVRPLLSFPSVEGSWCREYLLGREDREWRGVACRSAGHWETAVLAAEQPAAAEQAYRPAGAVSPDEVVSFIDTYSADIPLSGEQEAEKISRGWE
jgi:hypothetical protein